MVFYVYHSSCLIPQCGLCIGSLIGSLTWPQGGTTINLSLNNTSFITFSYYFQLRVAMFLDHHYQLKELLTTNSQFSYPLQPDRRYTPVAILDICRAVAAVFQTPGRFTHKIYHLASDRFSMAELAKVGNYFYIV